MELKEALARAESWRSNPGIRPLPKTARDVAATLAGQIALLEAQLVRARRLAAGRKVLILRGNPARGPETGPGFGRKVPAVILDAAHGLHQVECRLLADDPDAVGSPCRTEDIGLWSASQILVE